MENSEAFEPYATYPASAHVSARGMNNLSRKFPHLNLAHPVDGDAVKREEAAELGATLRSIVAGPKLSGTAWVQVLP